MKEFVMRGQTASGEQEVLNFSGFKPGMAYRITEFVLYPSTNIAGTDSELTGSITAGKTAVDPVNPDFNNEGLIATFVVGRRASNLLGPFPFQVVNDTFLITQNLILSVNDTQGNPVNWQCRFEEVKMSGAEEAVTNYKQFLISDE
tara:strand:- start:88 stop:525 length:438 start_codon:yes stop_codon:yes gene_type:complete